MSRIEIRHPHSQQPQLARQAAEDVARKLAERFHCQCQWDGDALDFRRDGVDGRIELGANEVRVTAELGFMLSLMQAPIESEIRRVLSEKFA